MVYQVSLITFHKLHNLITGKQFKFSNFTR